MDPRLDRIRPPGRDPSQVKLVEYIRICVDEDEAVARRAYARATSGYALGRLGVPAVSYRAHFERMGFTEDLARVDKLRERNEALDLMVYSHAAACHPHLRVDKIKSKVYVAGAIEDATFPDEAKHALEAALTAAHVDHTVETYPARHGFAVFDNPTYNVEQSDRHFAALEKLFAPLASAKRPAL